MTEDTEALPRWCVCGARFGSNHDHDERMRQQRLAVAEAAAENWKLPDD